ncbi:MAG: c-type cytochrome [Gammaproteobacteria bacterium]|nr:c-type cytochrome [Gammaproteobacteria bacterium]
MNAVRWVAGGAGLVAALAAAFCIRETVVAAHLVAADPDALAADASLTAFGAARGAPLYRRHCEACHGAGGAGDTRAGVPNLADGDWLYGEGRVSDIENVIEHGIRAHSPRTWNLAQMPAYARPQPSPADPRIESLSPAEIRDLTEYVLDLGHRPHDAAAALEGRQLFIGRGACYDCHSPDGRGDSAIGAPNLTDGIWLYGEGSRADIIETLEHGRGGVCPAWSRKLTAADIRELAVYVYSLSLSGAASIEGE